MAAAQEETVIPSAGRAARLAAGGICLVALVLSLRMLLQWVLYRPLDVDEIEFVRATRWVAEGKVPYLDFWEHHFPLQWYLMAPLARLAKEASVESFRVMRFGNAVFWLSSAVLVVLLGSGGGRRRIPALVATILLISAQCFPPYVTTYRIDGPMCFFYLLGVYLLERGLEAEERAGFYAASAGAAMAFSGLCSQRAIPGIAVAALLYLFVRPGESWGLRRKAAWMLVSGAGIALAVATSWALLGGLGAFWHQNVVTNRLYEMTPAVQQWRPLSSLLRQLFLDVSSMQLLGLAAAASVVLALLRLGKPSFGLRMAVLTVTQIAFLATISSPFGYQLQLFLWLLALLASVSLDALLRLRRWPEGVVLLAVVAFLLAGSGRVTWRSPISPDVIAIQRHQDHVLRRLEEVTAPGDRVLDGCGRGMNRESAFVFWFLPRLVRVLTANGALAPLTEAAMAAKPPAAIVMDDRTVLYLKQVGLQPFVSTHYVPLERAIWVPGMSGRLLGGEEKVWTVLAGGKYRLVESARQAPNPWFSRPFDFPQSIEGPADRFVIDMRKEQAADGPRVVTWAVNGRDAGAGAAAEGKHLPELVELVKGSRLSARNRGGKTLAVFAVPERWNELMTMPCFPSWFELH